MFYLYFLCICLNVIFSVPTSHPEYYITFSCQVSLGSFWLWQFLRNFLLSLILTVLWSTAQVFWGISLSWICLMFFLLIWHGFCVLWGKTTKVKYFFIFITSYQGICYQYDLSLLILTLITWSSICQLYPLKSCFSPFQTVFFGRKSLYAVHKEVGVRLHLFEGKITTLYGILVLRRFVSYLPFMYLFNPLLNHCRLMGRIIFQYYFVLMLKLFQLWPSGALSAGSCVCLTFLYHCVCFLPYSLFAGNTRCSELILYTYFTSSRTSHLSKELCFLPLESGIRN